MGFWSIFLPALLAFIFSIILFYLTKLVSNTLEKRRLEGNLINEFELNALLLKNLLRELEHLEYLSFRNIAKNDKPITTPVYTNYRRFFTETFFMKWFLYEKLEPNDINKIDRILNAMNIEHQNYIRDKIAEWKTGDGGVDGDKKFRIILEDERNMISQFIRDIRQIKEKLETS